MLTSIQRRMNEYVTTVRESNDNLFFKSEFAGSEQKKDVVEGDILRDIQEVWEVATKEVTSTTTKATLTATSMVPTSARTKAIVLAET